MYWTIRATRKNITCHATGYGIKPSKIQTFVIRYDNLRIHERAIERLVRLRTQAKLVTQVKDKPGSVEMQETSLIPIETSQRQTGPKQEYELEFSFRDIKDPRIKNKLFARIRRDIETVYKGMQSLDLVYLELARQSVKRYGKVTGGRSLTPQQFRHVRQYHPKKAK